MATEKKKHLLNHKQQLVKTIDKVGAVKNLKYQHGSHKKEDWSFLRKNVLRRL